MTDILDKDGKVLEGAMSFYQLPGGAVLFSEDVVERGDCLVFDMARSAIMQLAPSANGQVQMTAYRCDQVPVFYEARTYMVPKQAVGRFNSTNAKLYESCRRAVSPIQLATVML